jgi:predicted DNA binding CopG/RHH family protein
MASGKSNQDILAKHKDELESQEQARWEEGTFYGEKPTQLQGEELARWEASRAKVHPTSIRLPPALLIELKKKASENGLGLHAYIRMVLTKAVKQSA